MDESNNSAAQVSAEEPGTPVENAAKPMKAWLAALLSLVIPGLGQLYDRRPFRGLALAASFCAVGFMVVNTRVLLRPLGLLSIFFLSVAARILTVVDAARLARTRGPVVVLEPRQRFGYFVVAALMVAAAAFPDPGQLRLRFRAYRVPSVSMCPTICSGERMVADPRAYESVSPQRGDLVMISHVQFGETLLIKRVIAIGGDSVTEGSQGQILVNGKAIAAPSVCGTPNGKDFSDSPSPSFKPAEVPSGQFFVVGDNLNNSFDSRFPEFGLVTAEQVRGKPLYLCWSANWSRFGCRMR